MRKQRKKKGVEGEGEEGEQKGEVEEGVLQIGYVVIVILLLSAQYCNHLIDPRQHFCTEIKLFVIRHSVATTTCFDVKDCLPGKIVSM